MDRNETKHVGAQDLRGGRKMVNISSDQTFLCLREARVNNRVAVKASRFQLISSTTEWLIRRIEGRTKRQQRQFTRDGIRPEVKTEWFVASTR